MKAVNNIDINKVVGIDIETVRYKKDFKDLEEKWQSAWEYKNKHQGAVPDEEDLEKLWDTQASLYAEFSQICAVSLCYISKGKLKCKQYVSEDEVTLLTKLAEDLNAFPKDWTLIGHAAKYFDYPILCKRFMANMLPIPDILDESQSKPWEMKLLCTNDMWKSFGTGPGASLQALCTLLNIPVSKTDMVGDEVGRYFFEGKLLEIAHYCNLDTIATFNVLCRYKRMEIFDPQKDVEFVNYEEVLKKKLPTKIFDRVRDEGLTLEIQQELIAIANKKNYEEVLQFTKAALTGKKESHTDKVFLKAFVEAFN